MQDYFSIGETAKMVNMTSETLRHYDRIDLVKPSKTDELTKYRYYSKQDIVLLNTVHALQCMDLSLQEIKEALAYNDLEKVIDFFWQAEKKADEKIAEIEYSKTKIQLAKKDYEIKLKNQTNVKEIFIKDISKRIIMLSDTLEQPNLENLWSYLSHFYDKIDLTQRDLYSFEDLAGVYTTGEFSRLFAVCIRYADIEGLKILPEGKYLCSNCTEESRQTAVDKLMKIAKEQYGLEPEFTVQLITVSGILQWNYQVQVYIGS